jgi:hypothetical protein
MAVKKAGRDRFQITTCVRVVQLGLLHLLIGELNSGS